MMATIEKRANNKFLIRAYTGEIGADGKRIRVSKIVERDHAMTKKQWESELQKIALEFESEAKSGHTVDRRTTLNEFSRIWVRDEASKVYKKTTLSLYISALNKHILPVLGTRRIYEIKTHEIQKIVNEELKTYSYSTVNNILSCLSSMLTTAVTWGLIDKNPCDNVKLRRKKNREKKIHAYTLEEARILVDLISDLPNKQALALYLGLFCGLRVGELFGLTWNDINEHASTISVNKTRNYISGVGNITQSPKNNSSIRVITYPKHLEKYFKLWRIEQIEERLRIGDQWNRYYNENPWIITSWNGNTPQRSTPTKWLQKLVNEYNDKESILAKEEKREAKLLPLLSYHKLRHTSATLLIAENMNTHAVSKRLGHSNISTTLDIYAQELAEVDKRSADKFDEIFNKHAL